MSKKTQESPINFRLDEASNKRLRKEAAEKKMSLKEYMTSLIQDRWKSPEKQAPEAHVSTETPDEMPPSVQDIQQPFPEVPPGQNQGVTWNPPQQQQQQAWGQQIPPPRTIIKSYRDMSDLEFFSSFLEQYNLGKRPTQILVDQCRMHGLPDPMAFNRTLHGVSGIKSATTTNMIAEIYSDALKQYQLSKNVHQSFLNRQNYDTGMQQQYNQPRQSYYDPGRQKIETENATLKATIKVMEENNRNKELTDIKSMIPDKNYIGEIVMQILQAKEGQLTKEEVLKLMREQQGSQQGIQMTGENYVELKKSEHQLILDERQAQRDAAKLAGYKDIATELIEKGGEAVGRGLSGVGSPPPLDQQPIPGAPSGFQAPPPTDEEITCLSCNHKLLLTQDIPLESPFTCSVCKTVMKLDSQGYLTLLKQGPSEEKSTPPIVDKPKKPEIVEPSSSDTNKELLKDTGRLVPSQSKPKEERLGSCSSCGCDVFNSNISGTWKSKLFCRNPACSEKIPTEKTDKEVKS